LIAMMRMFGEFGRLLESAISAPSLFGVIGLAIAVGVLLAAVATVLPAVKAARLVPMQAMRVE
jgi:ABC-type lipoprotein release transport system permease subunit